MKWAKTVLLFQAVVTLILGIVFFAQVLSLDLEKVAEYRMEIDSSSTPEGEPIKYIDLKARYASASYILLFVSLMELIIITKLLT